MHVVGHYVLIRNLPAKLDGFANQFRAGAIFARARGNAVADRDHRNANHF